MGKYKGQMVFEFVVATILFIGIVFYVIFVMNTTMFSYMGSYYKNHLHEEALRVSELLVHNKGIWQYDGANYAPGLPGLAIEWPVLNDTKIGYLSDFCSTNSDKLASIFGLESRGGVQRLGIRISNASRVIMDCNTGSMYTEQTYAERFAFSKDSGLLKFGIYVW